MPIYAVFNMVFSDEDTFRFESADDEQAIAIFHSRYEDGTDDGGWRLCRSDNRARTLASTEGGDYTDDKAEDPNYMNYV